MSVQAVNTVNTGLCPHGMSPGACPICSGMSGASQKVKTADFSAKPGEMSWNECAAIGAFLKSLKNARMAKDADYQQRLINIANFEAGMAKSAQNLNLFIQTMSQHIATKPLAFVAKNMVLPVVKFIQNLPKNVINMLAQFSGKLADISDKLAAVYGELKASVNKKISDLKKKVKKKLFSIFTIFETVNDSDENEIMIAFEKQIKKLKNFLEKITNNDEKEELEDEY